MKIKKFIYYIKKIYNQWLRNPKVKKREKESIIQKLVNITLYIKEVLRKEKLKVNGLLKNNYFISYFLSNNNAFIFDLILDKNPPVSIISCSMIFPLNLSRRKYIIF